MSMSVSVYSVQSTECTRYSIYIYRYTVYSVQCTSTVYSCGISLTFTSLEFLRVLALRGVVRGAARLL